METPSPPDIPGTMVVRFLAVLAGIRRALLRSDRAAALGYGFTYLWTKASTGTGERKISTSRLSSGLRR